MDASSFAQFLANGVIFGGILALAAIGLSLVYGILNLSNFAQGDFLTLGAFFAYVFGVSTFYLAAAPLVAIVVGLALVAIALADRFAMHRLERAEGVTLAAAGIALAVVGAFGKWRASGDGTATTTTALVVATMLAMTLLVAFLLALEMLVWRPLRRRKATTLTVIIVSIGVALIVRNALLFKFGAENKSFTRPLSESPRYFGVAVSDAQVFSIVAALVLIAAVHFFLTRTRVGKAMRAVRDNADLARVSGINVDRVTVYVWVLAGVLTTFAGVCLALVQNNTMNVVMGSSILLPLFAAVILGGLGSAYGAVAGGFVVGIAMKTSALWLGTKYEITTAFLILILVLFLRPQGIFGERVAR